MACHIDRLAVDGDDRAIAKFREDLAFVANAIVPIRIRGDLEDSLLVVRVVDEKGDCGRASPKAFDNREAGDGIARLGRERFDLFGLLRRLGCGDLLFH